MPLPLVGSLNFICRFCSWSPKYHFFFISLKNAFEVAYHSLLAFSFCISNFCSRFVSSVASEKYAFLEMIVACHFFSEVLASL